MSTSLPELITMDEVRKLLRELLGLKKLSRPSIYGWIKTRGLPAAIEFGIPRKWRRKEIEAWAKKHIEG